jgi:hypothetical protein
VNGLGVLIDDTDPRHPEQAVVHGDPAGLGEEFVAACCL